MITDQTESTRRSRRSFLKASGISLLGASAVSMAVGPSLVQAAGSSSSGHVPLVDYKQPTEQKGALLDLATDRSRRLHLVNEHTGDDFDVVYYTHGQYIHENVSRLNLLMRDRRANVATQMDFTLYDQLYLLKEELGTSEAIHVLSGYRTEATNKMLRRRSNGGVASKSLHMEGRAADIYIPGYSAKRIQKTALAMTAGGVGIYSRSNFVHLDTGRVRRWGS